MEEAWHSKMSINTKHEKLNYLFGKNAVLCLLVSTQEDEKEGRERKGQEGSLFRGHAVMHSCFPLPLTGDFLL